MVNAIEICEITRALCNVMASLLDFLPEKTLQNCLMLSSFLSLHLMFIQASAGVVPKGKKLPAKVEILATLRHRGIMSRNKNRRRCIFNIVLILFIYHFSSYGNSK